MKNELNLYSQIIEEPDKEFVNNLNFILPNLSEYQWKLLLPIIQGRVYSKSEQAVAEYKAELEKKLLHQKECIFLGIQKDFIKKIISLNKE